MHRHTLTPHPHDGQPVHAGTVACPSGHGSGTSCHPAGVTSYRTTTTA